MSYEPGRFGVWLQRCLGLFVAGFSMDRGLLMEADSVTAKVACELVSHLQYLSFSSDGFVRKSFQMRTNYRRQYQNANFWFT